MSKDLKIVCCQPDDTYYVWQVHLWLESLREMGKSDKAIVLIFIPSFREKNTKWQQVIDLYPEAEFQFYKDIDNVSQLLGIYIPVLRPYILWRYWVDHPEMSENTILYCDSDVIFMPDFDIKDFIDDDVCYLSDTNSYINAEYFDSKIKDVLPEKLEKYKTLDILSEATKIVGTTREVAQTNNQHSGGAQYVLKNIDASFWYKVMEDVIAIRLYLQKVNKEFFENENKGFQSWCADMWAVLWGLWASGHETRVIPEMGFSWAPDPIAKLQTHKIYHNAGIVGTTQDGYPCFYKAKYVAGQNPMIDPFMDVVLAHEETKKHCTWYYTKKLDELRNKYKLNY